MKEELNQLLDANKNMGPQSKFLERAFDIMMNDDPSLIPYVLDFQIHYFYETAIGSYNNEQRILSINIMNLYGKCFEPRIRDRKILALQVLKHELEHARQLQMLHDSRQDIETQIVHASLRGFALKNGLVEKKENSNNDIESIKYLKNDNYYLDPCERLAEIKAWKFVAQLLRGNHHSEELKVVKESLDSVYEDGYRQTDNMCPTYQFLYNLQLFEDLDTIKKLANQRKYNYQSRLLYGLPISDEEKKVYQKKIKEK